MLSYEAWREASNPAWAPRPQRVWDMLSEYTLCTSLSPPGNGHHPVRDKRKENGAQRKYTEKKRTPAGPRSAHGDRAGHPLPGGLLSAPLTACSVHRVPD